jgi:uncharacterized membrane protein
MNPGLPVTDLKKLVSVEKLALMAIAIAIVLRIVNLGSRELWYDEVLSLLLSTGQRAAYQTPGDTPVVLAEYTPLLSLPIESSLRDLILTFKNLLLSLLAGEPHPPIFFLSQHFWLRLFTNSEAAMRSLNVLFSIAAIFSSYSLGKVVIGHRGGLFVAALVAINPFYLFHSLNVRMYAPLPLWTTLSATALLHLIEQQQNPNLSTRRSQWFWNILLVGSVVAGLLTFYLYGYWVITLFALVLYLAHRHWWRYIWPLATGVIITLPWMLWGALKQFRNADLNRFGSSKGFGAALLAHLQGITQVLGSNLLLGDWVTSIPVVSVAIAGGLIIGFIVVCSLHLWRRREQKNLGIALILGIFPLLLALIVDIATQKYTLGFGWGRTMIMILPGCLLLFTLWLERVIAWQWRTLVASGFLLLYLTIGVSDFSLRQRSVFHAVAEVASQSANQPTLIAMNSKAWGHVMRLAYYIPPSNPVMLLAQHPKNLATDLEKSLNAEPSKYPRILWLDSANPIWSRLKTKAEVELAQQEIQQVLHSHQFQLQQTQNLLGTMDMDNFTMKLYTRSSTN